MNSTKKDAGDAGGDGAFNLTSVDDLNDDGSPKKIVKKQKIPKEPGSRHRYLQQQIELSQSKMSNYNNFSK